MTTPQNFRTHSALVTGCAGFIGSHLTERLLALGWDVAGVDSFNGNYDRSLKEANLKTAKTFDSFEFTEADLCQVDLAGHVQGKTAIFHLAAEPGVRASWGDGFEKYVRNNVVATQRLLDAASCADARFIYGSSSSIYGQSESFPTSEAALPRPFSPYGVSKLAAEHLGLAYALNSDLEFVALRFFTVYGPRQRPDMAFTRFLQGIREGDALTIYSDGQQSRDFTFVGDVVDALVSAASSSEAPGRVFNIGGGVQVKLLEAIQMMEEVSGLPASLELTNYQRGDVRKTSADTTAARNVLGFDPRTSLRDGLTAQWKWVQSLSEPIFGDRR